MKLTSKILSPAVSILFFFYDKNTFFCVGAVARRTTGQEVTGLISIPFYG